MAARDAEAGLYLPIAMSVAPLDPTRVRARRGVAVALLAGVLASAALVSAQFDFGRGRVGIRMVPRELPDRSFTICRIMYESVRSEAAGAGWQTDYPYGDNNLMIRFSELTRAPVSKDAGRRPNHYVVRLTDDALFNCPYTVASDVGTMGLREIEVLKLREYCSRAASCGWTTSGAPRRGSIGPASFARCCPAARSRTCRSATRSSGRSSS